MSDDRQGIVRFPDKRDRKTRSKQRKEESARQHGRRSPGPNRLHRFLSRHGIDMRQFIGILLTIAWLANLVFHWV
ncbi:MAG: hypothetical protein IMW91_02705 [Firmicutes bacterium]|nr:hypothetical protein [Bacillota bacterium]